MMPTQMDGLKNILVNAFLEMYQHYQADDIYACCLTLDEFLLVEDLTLSTEKSIFSDQEDRTQYLAEKDRWNVQKWRYRSTNSSEHGLKQFRHILLEYFQSQHSFGNPLLNNHDLNQSNHLDLILTHVKAAIDTLEQVHHLDLNRIVFFLSAPTQDYIEIHSAKKLNKDSLLLRHFLFNKNQKNAKQSDARSKLSQTDKDMLVDLGQIVEIEPYDYLQVAHQAYLLTLEPYFIDTNPYIQKLVHHIAAMAFEVDGSCALSKDEILQRLQQFHHAGQNNPVNLPI